MDQCNFFSRSVFWLVIGDLVVRLPVKPSTGSTGYRSVACKIFFKRHSCNVFDIPCFVSNSQELASLLSKPAAIIDLSDDDMTRLAKSKKLVCMTFELYARSTAGPNCGFGADRLLGTVTLPIDFCPVRHDQDTWLHCGWLDLDKKAKKENRLGLTSPQLHVSVRTEPDQRLSFKFTGSPKGNVKIYYAHDSTLQPVFTSTFTWGPGLALNSTDKPTKGINGWLRHQICSADKKVELRSGWSVTICDTTGSPVATGSMVVPYAPDMQPQAWLIEQLVEEDWVAWGRLAAWHAAPDPCIHIRFEREEPDDRPMEWSVNLNQGGTLSIDHKANKKAGFVFSTVVTGEGNRAQPTVEVSVKHISCVEDAASFLVLTAAVNLSVDTCRPFI